MARGNPPSASVSSCPDAISSFRAFSSSTSQAAKTNRPRRNAASSLAAQTRKSAGRETSGANVSDIYAMPFAKGAVRE